jgi:hypothetical protein
MRRRDALADSVVCMGTNMSLIPLVIYYRCDTAYNQKSGPRAIIVLAVESNTQASEFRTHASVWWRT